MKTHSIENKKAWIEMLKFVDAFLPRNTWPKPMRHKIFGGCTITHTTRLKCCLFLYGNGIPPHFIRVMMQPCLRDKSAVMHLDSILKDLESNKNNSLFYFDVNQNDYLLIDGSPCPLCTLEKHNIRISDEIIFNRKLNAWNFFSLRNKTSIFLQHAFFSDMHCTDPFEFMNK